MTLLAKIPRQLSVHFLKDQRSAFVSNILVDPACIAYISPPFRGGRAWHTGPCLVSRPVFTRGWFGKSTVGAYVGDPLPNLTFLSNFPGMMRNCTGSNSSLIAYLKNAWQGTCFWAITLPLIANITRRLVSFISRTRSCSYHVDCTSFIS